jgi:hypothetical protein
VTVISLHGGCTQAAGCVAFAASTYGQLSAGDYVAHVSLMELPEDPFVYLGTVRTARKRAARCARLGYRFERVVRHDHEEAVFEINTSMPERQGRPMSGGYLRPQVFNDPVYPCPLHAVHPYGVVDGRGRLRAYLWLYRLGELAMVSSILGHRDHLRSDVMYLLFTGMVADQATVAPGVVFYNRHDSGGDGLRFFKERLGLRPGRVEWALT